jgi:hypothetical protein
MSVAGFSKDNKGFCFVTEQNFAEVPKSALKVVT